jgi:hypothetical protein
MKFDKRLYLLHIKVLVMNDIETGVFVFVMLLVFAGGWSKSLTRSAKKSGTLIDCLIVGFCDTFRLRATR